MLKLLIAVMSCHKDIGTHDAIRKTWGSRCIGCDYKLFVGGSSLGLSDEVLLDCNDDYQHVTEKSREIFKWALNRDYTHVLHCGRDTYVYPQGLMQSGLEEFDYLGHRTSGGTEAHWVPQIPDKRGWYEYTSGGAGTWLSRRSMQAILDSSFYHVADDLMYGVILANQGIKLRHDPRFLKLGRRLKPGDLTVHMSVQTGRYLPSFMIRAHTLSMYEGAVPTEAIWKGMTA